MRNIKSKSFILVSISVIGKLNYGRYLLEHLLILVTARKNSIKEKKKIQTDFA